MSPKDNLFINNIVSDIGSPHPIEEMKNKLVNILESFGFNYEEGPEIETEEYNFDMLNIKKNHPARQMHDTFYIENKTHVLRTHTSPVQIRSMLKLSPPISIVSAGKVYRKDDDATHLPMFHQVEAICLEQDIKFSNLKYLIYEICSILFGSNVKIRFRPSFFPFTEPSFEMDFYSPNLGKLSNQWLEIMGCGMVDPEVFNSVGIDPNEYSGYAFGMGIERIAMILQGVDDIRYYYQNDIRFLRQFSD